MKLFGNASPLSHVGARKDSEVFHAPADALVFVQTEHTFYRNAYRALVAASLGLGVLLIGITVVCWLVVLFAKPQDRFFTASVDGKVEQLLPLDTPTSSIADMQARVAGAVANALTFGYLDYDQRRAENRTLFSPQAYDSLYQSVITPAGLERMRNEMLVFRTEVEPALPGGLVRGGINRYFIYEWVFQIPLRITSMSDAAGAQPVTDYRVLQVLVRRATDVDVRGGYIITDILSVTPVAAPPAPAQGQAQGQEVK